MKTDSKKISKVKTVRLDDLLVQRKLCESTTQCKAIIMAGKVRIKDQIVDKPGKTVPEDIELQITASPRFVSRGGEKMEGFLAAFPIDVTSFDILDVGASTGGFTDCLLQHGAASAVCVDVGHGQLHHKLRIEERVTNLEKVNARHMKAENLPKQTYDLICMDLSFISLKKVLGNIWSLLKPGGYLIALVKPQFEADKKTVDQGRGVIRDETIQEAIIEDIRQFALTHLTHAQHIGEIPSPIKGADGNREFLLGLRKAK